MIGRGRRRSQVCRGELRGMILGPVGRMTHATKSRGHDQGPERFP